MAIKTTLNYSPNFNQKRRSAKKIKFIIFHYTGMKKESEAIKKLTEIQSEVSCHYLVKNNGEIITMIPATHPNSFEGTIVLNHCVESLC